MLDNLDEEGMPIPRICDKCKKSGLTTRRIHRGIYFGGIHTFDACEACVKSLEERRKQNEAKLAEMDKPQIIPCTCKGPSLFRSVWDLFTGNW